MVLQRYALRFTISDATLDSLKLPRSTTKPKQDLNLAEQLHKAASPVENNSEMSDHLHKPELTVEINEKHTKPEDTGTDASHGREKTVAISATASSPLSADTNVPPQSLQLHAPQAQPKDSPATNQKQPVTEDAQLLIRHTSPQDEQAEAPPPPAPTRPIPLLVAKPYCQPRSTASGHKAMKVEHRICHQHSLYSCYSRSSLELISVGVAH